MDYKIIKLAFALLLAIVPAAIWGWFFYHKQKGKKSMILKTFMFGSFFVLPLLGYKYLWQYFPWINAFQYTHPFRDDIIGFANISIIPLDVLLTFMLVGVIEEITKLWAVKCTNRKIICSVDDAIEMCIMAALGFSFAENIVYFYNILATRGVENIIYPFIFRSLFSTFAHIMFSGILGYYYGLSLFANDLMKEQHSQKRWKGIKYFAQLFNLKKEVVFHDEKLTQGLLIAIILHALFNIFLEMNWTFLLIPFLTGGFIYLNYLFEQKELQKDYCVIRNHNEL